MWEWEEGHDVDSEEVFEIKCRSYELNGLVAS